MIQKTANEKNLFQNVSNFIQNNEKILGSENLNNIQTFARCNFGLCFFGFFHNTFVMP